MTAKEIHDSIKFKEQISYRPGVIEITGVMAIMTTWSYDPKAAQGLVGVDIAEDTRKWIRLEIMRALFGDLREKMRRLHVECQANSTVIVGNEAVRMCREILDLMDHTKPLAKPSESAQGESTDSHSA
jgi:hypothetical protein